jgi:putative ABC transport system permease protein
MGFLNELREGLGIAWDAIRSNPMRSALTTLGVVIGVVTVTLMGTAINGLNRAFRDSISVLGTDVLYATRIDWFIGSQEAWEKVSRRQPIELRQVEAVAEQMTLARAVAPVVETRRGVRYGNRQSDSVSILGSTEQLQFTGGMSLAQGRFLSAEEVAGGRPVCVVGHQVATNLFGFSGALGARIKIDGRTFQVVGVMAKQGEFLGAFSLDNQVIIPVRQFITEFRRHPDFQIQVKVGQVEMLEEARAELEGILRKVRRVPPGEENDFGIEQQDSFIKMFNRVAGVIAAVGLFITGLALFVGGIGIMNIMFVSVAERTHEIGIRKAIGAKRRAILIQFLLEAASLCLLGGLIALVIAWPVTFGLSRVLPSSMNLPIVGIALLVSVLTGLLAGAFPAWRAARMDPVEALRNE